MSKSPLKQPPKSRINLSVALTAPMLVHRVFFVSPITRGPDGYLRSSTILVIYYYLAMVIYTGNVMICIGDNAIWTRVVIELFGYIWYGISSIDFAFGRFSFLFIVSMSLYRRSSQIEFFHSIAAIDRQLRRRCDHQVRYERLFYGYLASLIFCACDVYIGLQVYLVPVRLMTAFDVDLPILTILFTFVVDRATTQLITCAVVGCTVMIRTRLEILTELMEKLKQRKVSDVPDLVCPKFEDVLNLFVELCRLIELLNSYVGGIMVMRFAHDFVKITTSAYLLRETAAFEAERVSPWGNGLADTVYSFLVNLSRPTIVCLSGEWMMGAAEECRNQLFKYQARTNGEKELQCSFHYWSLHQRWRFSAAQFLDINAAMLYSILGAMTTYLFVLIQFQLQELELEDNYGGNKTINLFELIR